MVITSRSDLGRIKWNFTHRKCWMIGHVSAAAAERAAHYVGIQVYVYIIYVYYVWVLNPLPVARGTTIGTTVSAISGFAQAAADRLRRCTRARPPINIIST